MKKAIFFLSIALSAMAFTFALSQWKIADDTKTNFSVKGMMGEVKGTLDIARSEIIFDESNLGASSVSATLNVNSLNTNNKTRDKHLKSDDYFDLAKYPEITFKSTKIEKQADGSYTATGDLKIKEISKQVSIPFTFSQADNNGSFVGNFSINRLDYGVGKKGKGVATEVNIKLQIPVEKQ